MRVGVITNPRSGRNRAGGGDLRAVLARHPDVAHVETSGVGDVAVALRALAEVGVELVVVNGGDGTVQAVLTRLNAEPPLFAAPPRLAVLPAGTTNLIALDVGVRGRRPAAALARLLDRRARGRAPVTATRHLVAVRTRPGGPAEHGLFFGAGAFHDGVMLVRRRVHALGIRQGAAAGAGVAAALVRTLWGSRGADDPAFRGVPLAIEADGVAEPGGGRSFLLIGTTLERLMLGLWPFWGAGDGPMRLTSVDHPPRRLAFALPPALRGRPRPWMDAAGYRSRRAWRARLRLDGPLVLDGEILHPEPGAPFLLDAGGRATFVRA